MEIAVALFYLYFATVFAKAFRVVSQDSGGI
jgi:hypothetical protein